MTNGGILDIDALSGLELGNRHPYDAVVLDVMLPGIDGLDVCRRLRREGGLTAPVLMLTARDTLADKLSGFESGADDYLVKPFDLEELEARLRSLIRRHRGTLGGETLSVGDLVVDLRTHEVTRNGSPVTVTPIGLKILVELMRRSPRLVERAAIERVIWGDEPPEAVHANLDWRQGGCVPVWAYPRGSTVAGCRQRASGLLRSATGSGGLCIRRRTSSAQRSHPGAGGGSLEP